MVAERDVFSLSYGSYNKIMCHWIITQQIIGVSQQALRYNIFKRFFEMQGKIQRRISSPLGWISNAVIFW